ncbi:MAG: ATP-binding protein [Planctomycetes bacterium]|jgi:serine/threonine-protein kinase RsbW|nr:ATP-binding protein [Planctomycetota bacterium]MCL4731929.1 ATP-binding protein [Planctomycetota bacterium]
MSDARVTDRLEVSAHTRNLALVREFLHAAIKRSALPPADINKVVLAVDEAVANTIQHGYEGREPGSVEIVIDADHERFTIKIRDNGASYDSAKGSEQKAELDLQKHIASGNKRGLGLFIMRKVMDEVTYTSREGERNELTLVKLIRPRN